MSEDWDILMQEAETGTWFQSEEAWRFYCACTEWMTPFHTEVRRGKRAVGMVTGYISKEKRAWKQRLSCRAIIFGGPLLAQDATIEEVKRLLRETEAEIQRLSEGRVIYIETRNFVDLSPWREAFEACGWEYRRHYDIHVDCRDGEAMWGRIHESKRRAITHAGVEVERSRGVGDVDQWYSLLEELYKKKVHRPLWPKEFFEKAIEMGVGELLVVYANKVRGVCEQSSRCMQAEPAVNTLEKYTQQRIHSNAYTAQHPQRSIHSDSIHSEAFTAQQEVGKVIGGMFVVKDERRVYEWYVVGPVPATYAGLRYAVETGRETFDFMGAGEPGKPYGVRDFKMQFGGELKEPGRWIHICKKGYYRLGEIVYGILR